MIERRQRPGQYLESLGPLALASRLRRIADRMTCEVADVYRDQSVTFHPRWFGVFHLLSTSAPVSIREAASCLGVSHTAVSVVVKEMQRARLVSATRDRSDGRRRRLTLSPRGVDLSAALQPLWQSFEVSSEEVLREAGSDLLGALNGLERSLDRRSLSDRIGARVSARRASG